MSRPQRRLRRVLRPVEPSRLHRGERLPRRHRLRRRRHAQAHPFPAQQRPSEDGHPRLPVPRGGDGGRHDPQLAFGLLTEAGYQIQLKTGRNKYVDSNIIDGISNVGDSGITQLNNYEGGEVYGQYTLPEITVVAESATTATVYTRVSPNSLYIPPAPFKYYSPTLYRLIPLLRL